MNNAFRRSVFGGISAVLVLSAELSGYGQETNPDTEAVRAVSQKLVDAVNRQDSDGLAGLFMPEGELIDDAGNSHRGRDAIMGVFREFVKVFPDARMTVEIESIRLAAGELAIESATRSITAAEGGEKATNRCTTVYLKRGGTWWIALIREVPDDPEPTPRERLAPLAWLVGDWVDEDAEAAISISCRPDEGGNFLVAEFEAKVRGETQMKSSQRIGWDPLAYGIRSWVFDSDGGYGEGRWTEVEGKWIVKSTAVLPDGTTGSATLYFEPVDKDRFLMKGFDRVLGDAVEADFEAVIVRRPPAPGK